MPLSKWKAAEQAEGVFCFSRSDNVVELFSVNGSYLACLVSAYITNTITSAYRSCLQSYVPVPMNQGDRASQGAHLFPSLKRLIAVRAHDSKWYQGQCCSMLMGCIGDKARDDYLINTCLRQLILQFVLEWERV